MRVEAYTQVQQLYNSSKKTVKAPAASSVGKSDEIQISSIGKDFQIAKSAVAASSDVREDVVASLKADIQNGSYYVSGENFAEKLMRQYEEFAGVYAL